ncbi:hypothetical protein TGP89_254570B [Toxoplasma gondii p89]|uniref:Uncharacterized protein n=1 Tax=Toxoplasma gondii p89 TaxID=943119 RepID=A0A086KQM9_TOXGO|nr:hypothetical protein TGP89_254570B [Toxoplasma gondii p89]
MRGGVLASGSVLVSWPGRRESAQGGKADCVLCRQESQSRQSELESALLRQQQLSRQQAQQLQQLQEKAGREQAALQQQLSQARQSQAGSELSRLLEQERRSNALLRQRVERQDALLKQSQQANKPLSPQVAAAVGRVARVGVVAVATAGQALEATKAATLAAQEQQKMRSVLDAAAAQAQKEIQQLQQQRQQQEKALAAAEARVRQLQAEKRQTEAERDLLLRQTGEQEHLLQQHALANETQLREVERLAAELQAARHQMREMREGDRERGQADAEGEAEEEGEMRGEEHREGEIREEEHREGEIRDEEHREGEIRDEEHREGEIREEEHREGEIRDEEHREGEIREEEHREGEIREEEHREGEMRGDVEGEVSVSLIESQGQEVEMEVVHELASEERPTNSSPLGHSHTEELEHGTGETPASTLGLEEETGQEDAGQEETGQEETGQEEALLLASAGGDASGQHQRVGGQEAETGGLSLSQENEEKGALEEGEASASPEPVADEGSGEMEVYHEETPHLPEEDATPASLEAEEKDGDSPFQGEALAAELGSPDAEGADGDAIREGVEEETAAKEEEVEQ